MNVTAGAQGTCSSEVRCVNTQMGDSLMAVSSRGTTEGLIEPTAVGASQNSSPLLLVSPPCSAVFHDIASPRRVRETPWGAAGARSHPKPSRMKHFLGWSAVISFFAPGDDNVQELDDACSRPSVTICLVEHRPCSQY